MRGNVRLASVTTCRITSPSLYSGTTNQVSSYIVVVAILVGRTARVTMVPPSDGGSRSATDLGVLHFGRVLLWPPPCLVPAVPVDRRGQAVLEVAVPGGPTELGAQLRGVDRVPHVVAGAVADQVECILAQARELEDQLDHLAVVLLAVGADQVRLADLALVDDRPDGGVVVLDVDPVADVQPLAVELGADAVDDVGDLARDELLDVLIGPVGVRAVRDRGLHTERADPRAYPV